MSLSLSHNLFLQLASDIPASELNAIFSKTILRSERFPSEIAGPGIYVSTHIQNIMKDIFRLNVRLPQLHSVAMNNTTNPYD